MQIGLRKGLDADRTVARGMKGCIQGRPRCGGDPYFHTDLHSTSGTGFERLPRRRRADLVAAGEDFCAQPSVRKIGTIGYCMGGPFVFRTAAAFPDRIGAGATFHGGGLVTDKPNSPHLLIPQMKAHYLIAIAENDDKQQPNAKDVLRESFAKAKLPAEIEVYAGTLHGWCPPDSPVYNHDQAEKAWSRMIALFTTSLAGSTA
jgi:carboxymethylenebutenolidase